jgi:hypothetical protein
MSSNDEGQHRPGDPIAEVFPADECVARFMVAMAMARNDIDRAQRDADRAAKLDAPDFTYRVRLTFGHLVEADDSLKGYSEKCPEINALLDQLDDAAKKALKIVRGTLQRAGPKVLEHVRHNTFHYPSPTSPWRSDEQLQEVLAGLGEDETDIHFDGDTKAITHTYADKVGLALALRKAADEDEDLRRQMKAARDGAAAFVFWADALLLAYLDSRGSDFGVPLITDKPQPDEPDGGKPA